MPENKNNRYRIKSPYCTHTIPSSLLPLLRPPTYCPICTIKRDISEVEEVQLEFRIRGGIFSSKALYEKSHVLGLRHKEFKKRWVSGKVALMNRVMEFKDLLDAGVAEGSDVLREAVAAFEKERNRLARVLVVPRKSDIEKLAASSVVEERRAEQYGAATPPKSIIRKTSQFAASSDVRAEFKSNSKISAAAKDWKSRPGNPMLEDSSLSPFDSSSSAVSAPRSKRLRFSPTISHSPEKLNYVHTHFALPPSTPLSTEATHHTPSLHPTREDPRKRTKRKFKRNGKEYQPGTWKSEDGYEKVNTSRFRVRWDHAEKEWAEGEEMRLLEVKLKEISRASVALWWVRGVLVYGGIQEMQAGMEKVEERAEQLAF
ncbi:hypothetical protein BU26DRAFT_567235 [Trematosphaeria pertusa]|uniref:Uncharacterized protein n=1 Tax=Trematosphaeria pertusa TaxID=390896 RepID=A0A6A6I8K5_9PLEO|nr:uncharacterized protein BU26DRAFT_567235 [Trematosphaeria pertusa]KAF2246894.1 hypothetical protein BU26DRAFT_567235 [Trematosphaeria pertusa]